MGGWQSVAMVTQLWSPVEATSAAWTNAVLRLVGSQLTHTINQLRSVNCRQFTADHCPPSHVLWYVHSSKTMQSDLMKYFRNVAIFWVCHTSKFTSNYTLLHCLKSSGLPIHFSSSLGRGYNCHISCILGCH